MAFIIPVTPTPTPTIDIFNMTYGISYPSCSLYDGLSKNKSIQITKDGNIITLTGYSERPSVATDGNIVYTRNGSNWYIPLTRRTDNAKRHIALTYNGKTAYAIEDSRLTFAVVMQKKNDVQFDIVDFNYIYKLSIYGDTSETVSVTTHSIMQTADGTQTNTLTSDEPLYCTGLSSSSLACPLVKYTTEGGTKVVYSLPSSWQNGTCAVAIPTYAPSSFTHEDFPENVYED